MVLCLFDEWIAAAVSYPQLNATGAGLAGLEPFQSTWRPRLPGFNVACLDRKRTFPGKLKKAGT
jgi:hypothetical protein